MIPLLLFLLLLFLLGCVAVYVGTVVAAFSALMRLSLRLKAERNGRHDALDGYLDDPVRLFVPARVLLGAIFAVATVLFALLPALAGQAADDAIQVDFFRLSFLLGFNFSFN